MVNICIINFDILMMSYTDYINITHVFLLLQRPMPPLTPGDHELPPGYCAGCGGRILDRYYLHAVEKQWHMHCLTCTDCHFRLDSEITCFAREGNIYCKTDYYR